LAAGTGFLRSVKARDPVGSA
jgi:hypothetical protein